MINVAAIKSEFKDKRIVVLGLGLTGMSFVRFLAGNGIHFAVNDSRDAHSQFKQFQEDYPEHQLTFGSWDSALISSADVLLVSPGVDITLPEIAAHIDEQCDVMGDVELYARLTASPKPIPTVAITGSNGKSTVVNLIAHIGQSLGINTQLGGNVGVPVLDTLLLENLPLNSSSLNSAAAEPELLVLELSSFQLETLYSLQANVCCILNVSDDHLDRHKTLDTYQSLKQRIYQFADIAVYNRDDALTTPNNACATLISFGCDQAIDSRHFGLIDTDNGLMLAKGDKALMPLAQLPIAGIHNATNCLVALAVGEQLGWPMENMLRAITTFKGLAHRFETVASNDSIFWINDSKATNVGATVAAIQGLLPTLKPEQQLILIAGGDGKGADFSPLTNLLTEHVTHLITLGKDADQLSQLTNNAEHVLTMQEAVALAKDKAKSGDVVLLSPACASIDMFTNFSARGDAFVDAITCIQEAS